MLIYLLSLQVRMLIDIWKIHQILASRVRSFGNFENFIHVKPYIWYGTETLMRLSAK